MPNDVTRLLSAIEGGNPAAAEELLPLVYNELRKLASSKLARERAGNTLQPTALVHEAWIRLTGGQDQSWQNRSHFFAAAAEAMRRVLIDRARSKASQRRGGKWERVQIEKVSIALQDSDATVLAVHEALSRLEALDSLKANIVKLRYFIGMSQPEIAQTLGLSEATVRRHWAFARSWLYTDLTSDTP